MNNTGFVAELAVAKRLAEIGFTVSIPFMAQQARYDLLADSHTESKDILRVQVKHGRYKDGVVEFNAKSYCAFTKTDKRYTEEEIDLFGIYCSELDTVYLVPVGDIKSEKGRLRVDPARNGQKAGVTFAEPYLT